MLVTWLACHCPNAAGDNLVHFTKGAALSNLRGGGRQLHRLHDGDTSSLMFGDSIHLELHQGYIMGFDPADDPFVAPLRALSGGMKGKPTFVILSGNGVEEQGNVTSGDTVFLMASTGRLVETDEESLRARWEDYGDFQRFTIAKVGGGVIYPNDEIFLMVSHVGALVGLGDDNAIVASGNLYNDRQRLRVRRPNFGSLHSVVGGNGVLMITLPGKDRSAESLAKMDAAGIQPVEFAASSPQGTGRAQLQLTCPLEGRPGTGRWCQEMGHEGEMGCRSTIEQAITDSHRRAIVAALQRPRAAEAGGSDWTAIVEDDAVPISPEQFDEAFAEAWIAVPPETKIVRLGWCTFESDIGPLEDDALFQGKAFKVVRDRWFTDDQGSKHYYTGGCTTGYMIHRSVIPELLKMFPCCCPIDCCLERNLFYSKPKHNGSGFAGLWRGAEIMIDIDAPNSRNASHGFATFNQSGILFQDNRFIRTERPAWNTAR